MPFITYATAKKRLGTSVANALNPASYSDRFDTVHDDAAELVTKITGLAAPSDASDAPKWVLRPMVLLIRYFTADFLSDQSPEFITSLDKGYNNALKILEKYKTAPADGAAGNSFHTHGQFTGDSEGEWF